MENLALFRNKDIKLLEGKGNNTTAKEFSVYFALRAVLLADKF